MSEPISRVQRWPLPESQPVIDAARLRRLAWVESMRKVSHSKLSERDRECREEETED